ncbi:MAG: DUF1846 domain-containing protein [Eubacteriales bacterium]|nr:DUF1846 domain-containing protein [Eubacteriales bacterium]MDD3109476.1 DUF1846 domain-containing protein [Eubacteriales bacterium]MDD3572613.1 DUF1846 domain-containing protein [Eubacteriales bacterium]MDD4133556.1 DUF1846 domain-containing protein [Eubacteriales bacterium]
MNKGFDHELYTRTQSEKIMERVEQFGGKLYLELGGKLFDDNHAARVLPGFRPDSKIAMLAKLREQIEIIVVINANDIEKNKVRGDLGITYDQEVLRLIDAFEAAQMTVGSVVITHWASQRNAQLFRKKLRSLGVKVYMHYFIEGYPGNVDLVVSEKGYGRNDFVETTRPLVLVTAPGPGSGKMAVCMSQLYQEHQRGMKAGYAKFETFPIWNLPLKHPVNVAYEAATVDLGDVNSLDPFHLEAYSVPAVNYNRDIEVFPILRTILEKIWGEMPYQSPTDMGVNMVGCCLTDEALVEAAAKQEVIRRLYTSLCEQRRGHVTEEEVGKLHLLMQQLKLGDDDRPVIAASRRRAASTGAPAAAIELESGEIVTAKTTSLLGASAALLLNALKRLAGIPKSEKLIPPEVIGPVQDLKLNYLGNRNPRLHTDEVLVALSITAAQSKPAALALSQMPRLKGCEVHTSVILSPVDENIFRRLGVNLTCDPKYQTHRLYHS